MTVICETLIVLWGVWFYSTRPVALEVTVTHICKGYVWLFLVSCEGLKTRVDGELLHDHACWHSLLLLPNQCTVKESHDCVLHSWFFLVTCGCVRVRLYDDRCSSHLTLHKDHKSLVCRTISDPHPRFCPLPTFTTPNSQPISGWGNIYRPICSTAACGQAGGRYGGVSFGAETTNVSEQKLVT